MTIRPLNPKNIRHIFFDLDNTLWFYFKNAEITLKGFFERYQITQKYGLEFDEWHNTYFKINEQLWDQLNEGTISKKELRDRRFYESFKAFNLENEGLWEQFEENFLKEITKHNHLVDGSLELIEFLNQHFEIHVLTNGFGEVSHHKINSSALNGKFKTITTGDDTPKRKPHAIIFEHAMEKAGAKPENSLYIGDDWKADVLGAGAIGMSVIYLEHNQDEKNLPGLVKVNCLKEIIPLIQKGLTA